MYRQADQEGDHQGTLKSRYPYFAASLPSMLPSAIMPAAVVVVLVLNVTNLYTLIILSWSVPDQRPCKNPLQGRDQG